MDLGSTNGTFLNVSVFLAIFRVAYSTPSVSNAESHFECCSFLRES